MIDERLQDILRTLAPNLSSDSDIQADDKLMDLGIDSLSLVELIINIEDAFAIAIPDEDLLADNFATVGAVAGLVDRLRGAAA